ncbi:MULTISPECIES: hypothetical protein [unclassified Streptomyces]|uniref:hypothetical protein n=1 Tax=unclassified Streptomyces TaxID=2593676 RepID=UPI0013A6C895|nr:MULTISPECIES: hypothetical protein [unclassified Streptomyces]QZZ29779.1 hypothetical protein A7X85_29210 [Streptomyces sp. ST1015]
MGRGLDCPVILDEFGELSGADRFGQGGALAVVDGAAQHPDAQTGRLGGEGDFPGDACVPAVS